MAKIFVRYRKDAQFALLTDGQLVLRAEGSLVAGDGVVKQTWLAYPVMASVGGFWDWLKEAWRLGATPESVKRMGELANLKLFFGKNWWSRFVMEVNGA